MWLSGSSITTNSTSHSQALASEKGEEKDYERQQEREKRGKTLLLGLTEQLGDVRAQSVSLHGDLDLKSELKLYVCWEACAEENSDTEMWNDRQMVDGVHSKLETCIWSSD